MSAHIEIAFTTKVSIKQIKNGQEPLLGGQLREKAVWVDEVACIGCRYCAHVATNTFLMMADSGKCRAIRQDGDNQDKIREAMDTCPVDCIHWVSFEDLKNKNTKIQCNSKIESC